MKADHVQTHVLDSSQTHVLDSSVSSHDHVSSCACIIALLFAD